MNTNSEIDPEIKKKISNEKRLKAISAWKKNRCFQIIAPKPVHKVYEKFENGTAHHQLKLFDSGDEAEEKYEESFKVRPQFEGQHGKELLEMSSKFSGRFKLDERFKEDDEEIEYLTEKNEEKEKNLKILESIIGHEIPVKTAEKSSSRKRQIRFDPEDENALKYVKDTEKSFSEKPKKKRTKKEISENIESNIPISTEHYVEVSSNLKEILNTSSTPFSLTEKFNLGADVSILEPVDKRSIGTSSNKNCNLENRVGIKEKTKKNISQNSAKYFSSNLIQDSFFVTESDPRLKEGIQFFKLQKPLEDIRMEWQTRRINVLELFKKKRRSSQRSHRSSLKIAQRKNQIRKRNFKK